MKEKSQPNPLREGLANKAMPQPCAVVIFGATGDLTHRKLVPALYNIAADGELPPAVAVIGFARRPKTDDEFRDGDGRSDEKIFAADGARRDLGRVSRRRFIITRASSPTKPATRNSRSGSTSSTKKAAPAATGFSISRPRPTQFETIIENLQKAGLNKAREGSWARVILEKPFGTDLASAQHLNARGAEGFLRKPDLSDRSFPRQRNGAEHFGAAFRERDFRAALERAQYRSRADHRRGNAGRGEPRRLLRRRGRAARHGAESPAPAPLPRRDGAADRSRRGQHSR